SSAHDMARWLRFVLDSGRADGRAGGRTLLKPATVGDLLSPQALVPASQFYPTARLTRPHFTAYGLGWFLHDYDGRAVAMHTGSIDGMVAIVGLVPDERLGVVVLANLDHAELRHALMYRVFDLYGPRGAGRDWSREMLALYRGLRAAGDSAERAEVARRVPGTRHSAPLARYAGVYRDSLYGDVVVSADGERLGVRFGPGFVAPLEHWHYDTFRATWEDRRSGRSLLTFTLDAQGKPTTLRVNGWDAEFRRLADAAPR
ncbi:MAG TPA: DUF3471 domain-containing protein, partial [Gemmatimonadaceae bacterium]|nr:DUF3471 domain-containing protein [Gemmatimonadaceae bacterium]